MTLESVLENIPLAPADPILGLNAKYIKDPNTSKVNVGVGAYRDDDGKPWILPCVQKAELEILNDSKSNHEYLAIDGLDSLKPLCQELIFGSECGAISENRIATIQSLSGTGALYVAFQFLKAFYDKAQNPVQVYCSKETWGNHFKILDLTGFKYTKYPYFDPSTLMLDFSGFTECLNSAPKGSIVILHACAHNPTGIDPTIEQWGKLADIIQERSLLPVFDCAYQGYASGDPDLDVQSIRLFMKRNISMFVCQSFAKSFGLYGERIGAMHFVAKNESQANACLSQFKQIIRSTYSTPPAYGAKIVMKILSSPDLRREWIDNVKYMSQRIIKMRHLLKQKLVEKGAPGDWNHITSQIGMFSYTGLNTQQVSRLVEEFHIYMTSNGRISMAGVTADNVDYIAECISTVMTTPGPV